MKIFLMTQNFYPEPGAPTNRLLSFARALAANKHDVTVICEFACYPSGVLEKRDKYRLYRKEIFENFRIVRTWVIPTRRANLISRLANYFSYMISAFFVGLFLKKPNLIIASSPPLFVGPSAVLLSKIFRLPLIADIRDLWPEDAIVLGHLKNPVAIWGGRLTANMLYKNAKLLTTISRGFQEYLSRVTKKDNVHILYNGSSVLDLDIKYERVISKNNNKFVVCYSGTLGLGQPVEDIVWAAKNTYTDTSLEYWIIGDGVRRPEIERLVSENKLDNIRIYGGVSVSDSLAIMIKADAAVVALYREEYYKSAIPSKFFDCMALGLPIILGVDGEAREIMDKGNTGIYYEPGNIGELTEAIYRLKENPQLAKLLSMNGKRVVGENYRRITLANKLNELITYLN